MEKQAWEGGALRNAVQPMWKTGSVPKGGVCLLMSLLIPAQISRTSP